MDSAWTMRPSGWEGCLPTGDARLHASRPTLEGPPPLCTRCRLPLLGRQGMEMGRVQLISRTDARLLV